ncbi:lipopolysaccharide assembly protein LapA domain-containing protein [Luteimonas kalidii]|uniref:Lipopolysaccharide assembly protein LapA domain-containing protein n=1 Tax=Luteimonas kalidii TaxID=3042025 RepID=A0ABT6JUK2_9GAMM|nr:lipopolysaccharide assembly protein LapA domain-containing protein [Luteimonas kalidii]MDH5833631.1 lipopolysaccharide assembly protein LapA domain-containing protein [Luteimonas kalidii]
MRILAALLFAAAGLVLGALNPQRVTLDLGIAGFDAGLGVMLLVALLLGALCAGLAMALGVVLPLRRQLKRVRAVEPAAPPHPPHDSGA